MMIIFSAFLITYNTSVKYSNLCWWSYNSFSQINGHIANFNKIEESDCHSSLFIAYLSIIYSCMKHVPNNIYSKKCHWCKNNSYFKIAVKQKKKICSKYFLLIRKTKMRYATTNTIRSQQPQLNPVTHIIFETSKLICHNIFFIIHFLLTSLLYCFFSYGIN